MEAGEDCYSVRIGLRGMLYGDFFIGFRFDELNQIEIAKHVKQVPERKYSARDFDLFGYKFRNVMLWTPEDTAG